MAFDGLFQRLAQHVFVRFVVFYRIELEPVTLVVLTNLTVFAPQVAACRELFNRAADRHQRLHFRGDIKVAVFVMTHIKRDDSNVVATNQPGILFAVVQRKGEHTL